LNNCGKAGRYDPKSRKEELLEKKGGCEEFEKLNRKLSTNKKIKHKEVNIEKLRTKIAFGGGGGKMAERKLEEE